MPPCSSDVLLRCPNGGMAASTQRENTERFQFESVQVFFLLSSFLRTVALSTFSGGLFLFAFFLVFFWLSSRPERHAIASQNIAHALSLRLPQREAGILDEPR